MTRLQKNTFYARGKHGGPTSDTSIPQVAVVHAGARLDYLAATALAENGMLARLYTDAVGNRDWVSSALDGLVRLNVPLPRALRRLRARKLAPVVEEDQLNSFPGAGFFDFALQALGQTGQTLRVQLPISGLLRHAVSSDGFRGVDILYTFHGSDAALAHHARTHGVLTVHDQFLNPMVGRILNEERARYPGLEAPEDPAQVERGIVIDQSKWRASDLILAPSEFVADEIRELGGPIDRVRVLPYGIDPRWLDRKPRPQRGRILFVGAVSLRKGAHVLAEMTRRFRARGKDYEVRVVGPMHPSVHGDPLYEGPSYIGQVPRGEVGEEFEAADVFAFPTLSDSFAMTHLEALSCGVPVVTTPNCGSTVRDGIEGFIVPIRDPGALAERVEKIIEDRSLRDRFSTNAKKRAQELTWPRYAERFVQEVVDLWRRRERL